MTRKPSKVAVFIILLAATILSGCGSGDTAAVRPETSQQQPTQTTQSVSQAEGSSPTTEPAVTTTPTVPPAPTNTPAPSPTATLGPTELACEAESYACSLGDVSEESLDRATAYADTMDARMRDGASTFEVVEWLDQQEGVEAPITDGRVIIYRVNGSVPIIVEHPGVATEASSTTGPNAMTHVDLDWQETLSSVSLPSLPAVPAAYAQPVISEPTDVVGSQRDNRNKKRALVLAPYEWHFGSDDDAPVAAEALRNTRWYEGNVTYVANANKTDQNVRVQDFLGWEQYDTIHVSTHGRSVCPHENACTTYLNSGVRIPEGDKENFIEQHGDLKGIGLGFVDTSDTDDDESVNQVELVVTADFFKSYYNSGSLKNKIFYFSACEILAQSDMFQALDAASDNSDFFSWTYSVQADDAMAVAADLYEKMAAQGQAAGDAYRRIPDDKKLNRPSDATNYDTGRIYGIEPDEEGKLELVDRTRTTDFLHYQLGQENNHIREVITLLDPDAESVLAPGTVYPMDGTLGDGEPEHIELLFKVEGYTEEEIKAEDILISFLLDDTNVMPYRAFLPADDENVEVTQEEDYTWYVRFKEVEIPDQAPDATVKFEADLQLPGGDPSVHTVEPIRTSQSDVRATIQQPLQAGQSAVFTYDRDSSILRADMQAGGNSATFFLDERAERFYVPNPDTGGYWFYETPRGETEAGWAFLRIVKVSEWTRAQLKDAGFQEEEFTCAGDATCYRYRTQEGGNTLTVTYNEDDQLVEFRVDGAEASGVVTYEYGEYSVQVPANASPSPVPNLPFSPGQMPGLPEVPSVP